MKKTALIAIILFCLVSLAWGEMSFKETKMLAENGNATAQLNLGYIYQMNI